MATIGDTSAPSTNTLYYDSLLTTTLDAWVGSGRMFDQIFKESAFLTLLRQKDVIQKQNGGERIRIPLMYGKNDTIKSYEGYDVLDTTPQDGLTTAFYEWRELGGTISISRREERQNSGEAAKINLLQSKIKQATMSMSEELNKQIVQGTVSGSTFVPGNGAKDLNPLGYFMRKAVATDPVAGGNVGNIASSNTWWRAKSAAFGGASESGGVAVPTVTTYKGMVVALRRLYNHCSKGSGGSPDIALLDQISFETYENALDEKVRYTDTKLADMGFDNIKLRGATCVWDEVVPDIETGTVALSKGTCFMLNSKFYHLIIDSETDVVSTPFIESDAQTAKVAKVLFMGNTAVSNLRKHGVGYEILETIVA